MFKFKLLSSKLDYEELKNQQKKYNTISGLYSTKGQDYNAFKRRPMRYVIENNLIPDRYNTGSLAVDVKEANIRLQLEHVGLSENRIKQLEAKCFSDNPENIAEDAELFSILLFIERLKAENLVDPRHWEELVDTLINTRQILDNQKVIDEEVRTQLNQIVTLTYELLQHVFGRGLQLKGFFNKYVNRYNEKLVQFKELALVLREQGGTQDQKEIGFMMLSVADGFDFLSDNSEDKYSMISYSKNKRELNKPNGDYMKAHAQACYSLSVYNHVSNNVSIIDNDVSIDNDKYKYNGAEKISELYPTGHNQQRYKGLQIYSIREALHYEWLSQDEKNTLLQEQNQWVFKKVLAYGYTNYNKKVISVNPFKIFILFKEMGLSIDELVQMPEEKFSALLEIFLNPSYIYQKTDDNVLKCIDQNINKDDDVQYEKQPLISKDEILKLSAGRIQLIVELYNRYVAIKPNQINSDGIEIDDEYIIGLAEKIKADAIDEDRVKKIEKACLSNDPRNAAQDLLLLDIRLYAEELMRSQKEVDAALRIKAGKRLAAVCDDLAEYNRREMSDDDRELLNEMIDKTFLQVGYAREGNFEAIQQGEEHYKQLAEKIGNRFDSRFVAKAFGWLGIILLVVGGLALSPLTAGFSGVLATVAAGAGIGGLSAGGACTLGGWGAFFYKKSKVNNMKALPQSLADVARGPDSEMIIDNDTKQNGYESPQSTKIVVI